MIKYEIVRTEQRDRHVKERDRLPVCQRDHRVAGTVLGQMVLHVIEVSEAPIADEIDLVFAGVEAVDRVMSDRLRENKEVLTTRAGQVILARPKTSTLSVALANPLLPSGLVQLIMTWSAIAPA